MKKLLILLILIMTISLSAESKWEWVITFDANSKLHFGACFTLNAIGHVISKYYITDNRVWNSIISGTFAMIIGIKKEYNDVGNSFDWDGDNFRDLRDDFLGTSASIITMQLFEPFSVSYDGEMVVVTVVF